MASFSVWLGAAARRFTTRLEAGVWLVSVLGWVPRQDGLRDRTRGWRMASFSVGCRGKTVYDRTRGWRMASFSVWLGAAARWFTTGLEAGVWLVSVFGWVPRQDGLRPD